MDKTCSTNWEQYDYRLTCNSSAKRRETIDSAARSFTQVASANPGYQPMAKRNGETQPMIATRDKNICKLAVFPQDNLCVGDLIECYNETWIVVDSYRDEFGLITGTSWLCNYELKFQNGNATVLTTKCVIDDGSYSTNTRHDITTSNAQYNLYLPLNDDTKKIYIDKRFAVGTMCNQFGEEILQVMKVTWIDTFSQQQNSDGHLLKLRITDDLYNKETDSLSLKICDYITNDKNDDKDNEKQEPTTETRYNFVIEGRDTLRIGTSRTYTHSILDADGKVVDDKNIEANWLLDNTKCSITTSNGSCKITVPLDDSLIGTEITLSITATDKSVAGCDKVIKVVTIG